MYTGRILILEDDPHVGKIIKEVAEASGLEARLLTVPDLFLSAYEEWKPSHIALDLVVPDMDGVQVLAELSNRGCTAKIIITSGMGSRVLDAAGRAGNERGLNIVGVLAKPFSAAALRALLTVAPPEALAVAPQNLSIDLGAHVPASINPSELELRRALKYGEFKPFYQPKIECMSGRVAGYEALARWLRPGHGMLLPDQFMPHLVRTGLIDVLTDAVLDEALAWFSESSGIAPDATMSVNFSAKTFRDPAFLDRIVARCRRLGIAPHRLIVELTETDSMDDPLASLDLMTRLRMKGFLLSIDDFGTGYSSLLQLVRLPFSEIKVDKSFVMAASRSTEARAVVISIVDLGRSLGLKSAAEGVDDLQILDFLNEIGCDLAQGFAIARPMEGAAIEQWQAAHYAG